MEFHTKHSLLNVHGIALLQSTAKANRIFPGSEAGLKMTFGRAIRTFLAYRAAKHSYDELLESSDQLLRDIGINRIEVREKRQSVNLSDFWGKVQ